jgi:hypothetical protein
MSCTRLIAAQHWGWDDKYGADDQVPGTVGCYPGHPKRPVVNWRSPDWESPNFTAAREVREVGAGGGGSPSTQRGAASTWLPHQRPLWQAAPNADGADVSEILLQ